MDDWAALVTLPGKEYSAHTELQRLGLDPYLPQGRRRVAHPHRAGTTIARRYPLFPRYILIGLDQAAHPNVREAHGLVRLRPILADNDGSPWKCPGAVIEAIRLAEARGEFDDLAVAGRKLKLNDGILSLISARMTSPIGSNKLELLTPLFGGSRVTVAASRLRA